MKDEFKRMGDEVGDRWKCPCCGPSPDKRAESRRRARHRLKQETRKLIEHELQDRENY